MAALRLNPNLPSDAGRLYRTAVKRLLTASSTDLGELVRDLVDGGARLESSTEFEAAIRILADLTNQGWQLTCDPEHPSGVIANPPDADAVGEVLRLRIREQEVRKRAEQLEHPAVRQFVGEMETAIPHEGAHVSVFDLMRDGRDLEVALRSSLTDDRRRVVAPYVQVVEPGKHCVHTGRLLTDIWRYFRHTWANQYSSVPGRSMAFLVRDASTPRHSIIGIFALSSSVVQIGLRDHFLGWHPDAVMARLSERREPHLMEALAGVVQESLAELYVDDLISLGHLAPKDLTAPTSATIERLRLLSETSRAQHNQSPDLSLKQAAVEADPQMWRRRAETSLFRSKRAKQLADLLEAQLVLKQHVASPPTPAQIEALLASPAGRRVVRKLVRRRKARQVGIALADLSVCGAVAPYNHIFGGKLVAMLAASPKVVRAYSRRYADSASEIASAMAGRRLVREPSLVFIGTTSLYGVGLNQYTRVTYPCGPLGGDGVVRYRKLGRSEAFGTSQYTDATVDALALAAQRANRVRRVNNIFGEGQSPKLRLIREGLDSLDLPSDGLLKHHRARVVYGVELISNTREYLLGLEAEPRYLFDQSASDTSDATIADHWWTRWVAPRLDRDDLRQRVRAEVLAHPIRHGARVELPERPTNQLSVFDDLDE